MRSTVHGVNTDDPFMRYGLIGAVLLHIVIALLLVFGLPRIWQPEVIEEPIAVKLATLSDISAAPKTDQPSNKKPEKKPDQPTSEPPKPQPPQPAKSEPPPPAPAPQPQPQPEKKPETPKPPEKDINALLKDVLKDKPKPTKPEKPSKQQQQDFNSLLQNVLKTNPSPSKEDVPKKAQPTPAEPSSGPKTDLVSEVPMTATEEDGIRAQIQSNWNLDPGALGIEEIVVELRIALNEDGTVTKVEVLNDSANPVFRSVAESARRAVLLSSPLKIPVGKYWPTIVLRFNPKDALNGGG